MKRYAKSLSAFRCLTKPIADQDVQDNTIPPALIKVWQHMSERKLQKDDNKHTSLSKTAIRRQKT